MTLPKENKIKLNSSYKDPNGYVYKHNGKLLRQINKSYFPNYNLLKTSGLYQYLIAENLLVSHQEISKDEDFIIIEPLKIPFVSYPYEWCFSQLKDAALLTLRIQKKALEHQMTLKDANAFNVQFLDGKPIFIDTLSFEEYNRGKPWVAYRQFCMHFLAPLLLMSRVDLRLNRLLQLFIDGIPLDLTSSMLPKTSWINLGTLLNIHLHSKSEKKFSEISLKEKSAVNINNIYGLLDNLESLITNLTLKGKQTEWGNYYKDTNYTQLAFDSKKNIVSKFLKLTDPKIIWDLGANDGTFSRLINKNSHVTSFDYDPLAVELNYQYNKHQNIKNCLPLTMDLTNPSPSIGWGLKERLSLMERGEADLVMFLALIHHLVISNNLNFTMISKFLSSLGKYIIIEFTPKNDFQIQKLIKNREDIFSFYTKENFIESFEYNFKILKSQKIDNSERILYLMKSKYAK